VCLKKGGDQCYALAGNSKYLCITGGDRCYIVHPSDTAVALTALDASVEIAGPKALRRLPMEEYFVGPGQDIARETVLVPGELVTPVFLPTSRGRPPAPGAPGRTADGPQSGGEATKSLYLKAREREAGDFALVSVAVCLRQMHLGGATIRHASVVLGGVAPAPYRARLVEDYLQGKTLAEVDPVHAGSLAVPDARPMADNGYKVILAANLVKQAILQLLSL